MTGPLAQQIAQVRSGLNRYYDFCPHMSYCAIDGDVPCDCGRDQLDEFYKDALSALSVIERHVQEMELLIEAADRLSFDAQFPTEEPAALSALDGEEGEA